MGSITKTPLYPPETIDQLAPVKFYEDKNPQAITSEGKILPSPRWWEKWIERFHAWRLVRKWRGASPSLVMTTYQDKIILADNDTRRMYAITCDTALGWKIETIATF